MPLGLKNAPALFQRKMQKIFNENQEFVLVYIDDLLIFSKTYKPSSTQKCATSVITFCSTFLKNISRIGTQRAQILFHTFGCLH
jgi:hypothetical protein